MRGVAARRARRARHGERGLRLGLRRQQSLGRSTPSVRAPGASTDGCSERVGCVSGSLPPWVLVGSVGDPRASGSPSPPKSCRWRRPQSKGRPCVSGRARRDLRVRGGRGHLSERPGWPSGAPISRGSTVSMIAFGGRRGPHRSGSRCRGRPIERREAGREGCLWPNAASQGRPPDGSGGLRA